MNAPFAHIAAVIKHYLKCKSAAPYATSACFLVPSWQGTWRSLLSGMKLLKTYDKGARIFSAPVNNGYAKRLGPTPWSMEVWYDAPCAPMQVNALPYDQQPLLMTFARRVANHSAKLHIDNGATHNFIDAAFVADHNLKVYPCSGHVLAAGSSKIAIKGFVRERVAVQ